jgi:tetratricopeptide (TPR) repeat protein
LYESGGKDQVDGLFTKLKAAQPKSAEVAAALGDFYLQHQDSQRARAEYEQGLSHSPQNIDLMNRMVDALLDANKLQEAVSINQKALKVKPKDVIVNVQQGRILAAQGNTDAAITLLRHEVSEAPDSPQPHYFLGMALGKQGDVQAAESEMQEVLRITPDMPAAMRQLATMHLSRNETDVAKEYAFRCVRQNPGDPQARLLFGAVLLRRKEYTLAHDQFEAARQLAPADVAPSMALAALATAQGRFPDAQKEYEAALKLDPASSRALRQFIDYLSSRKESAKALALAKQFVTTYPNDAQGHLILGSVELNQKQYIEAKRELERAVELDQNLVNGYLELGKLHQQLNDTDDAIARYQQALHLNPKMAPLAGIIGSLYLGKGDLATARKYYEQALAINPNFAIAANNLAWVMLKQHDNLDVALGLAQKAKQLMPEVETITDTLAWIEYEKGSYTAAIPLLQECVDKDPQHASYRYHLGMALLASGDKGKGKEQLDAALKLNLGREDAQDARRALEQLN